MTGFKKGDRTIYATSTNKVFDETDRGPSPLPVGNYTVMIIDDHRKGGVARGKSRTTNQPYLFLTFIIIAPEQYLGRRIWGYLSLSDKALWKATQLLQAIEPDENERPSFVDVFDDLHLHNLLFYRPFDMNTKEKMVKGSRVLEPNRFFPIEDNAFYSKAWDIGESLIQLGKAGGGPRVSPDEEQDYNLG